VFTPTFDSDTLGLVCSRGLCCDSARTVAPLAASGLAAALYSAADVVEML